MVAKDAQQRELENNSRKPRAYLTALKRVNLLFLKKRDVIVDADDADEMRTNENHGETTELCVSQVRTEEPSICTQIL
jgi:hypothetical protein